MDPFRYIKDVEKKELFKGVIGQYLGSGENMNVMHWNFEDNVTLPEHHHESEQFGYVIKGGFRATIAGVTKLIEAGCTLANDEWYRRKCFGVIDGGRFTIQTK